MVERKARRPHRSPAGHELERQIAGLKPGDHLCLIYGTTAEQFAAVVPFIRDGLTRGERCLYIVDDRTAGQVVRALRAAGVDVDRERRRGAISVLTKRDTYLKSGTFSPTRMIGLLRRATDEALAAGFAALRATGEMTWALGPEPGVEQLIEYEARLNEFFPGSPALAICQYNRRRFPPAIIHEVLRTHPIAILGHRVCPNLYYEAPAAVLGRQSEAQRVDWMITQLRRTADAAEELREHERALRESEQRLSLHVQQTPLAVIDWDRDFRVRQWNPAAEKIFGYSAAEAIGQHARFIVPARSQGHVDRVWRELLARRGGERSTNDNVTKDGRTILCEWYNTPLVGSDGQVIGVACLVQDVTERQRAEEEILRLNRMYRVLSQTNQMVLRVQIPDELLREACRIAVEVGSLRMAWVGFVDETSRLVTPVASYGQVGTYLDDIRISADDIPEGRGPGGLALREGRHVVYRDIEREPSMAPWRQAALAMGYRSGGAFPLRAAGAVTGLLVVYSSEVGWPGEEEVQLLCEMANDISYALDHLEQERRRTQAEEARRASEAEYRALFDRSPYGVFRSTPEGRFLTVNPALVDMLGYESAEDVLRLDIGRDVYADSAEHERLVRERPAQTEVTWKRRDGTRMSVRLNVGSVFGPDGEIACFEVYAEDVTERRILEEQLRQAQKMEAIGQLAGGVAHDFNNLLATILACSELVASDHPTESASWEDLQSLREAAQHGAQLTKKLLAFSRRQTLEMRTVVLGTLVADFARIVRRFVPEDVELSVHVDAADATIRADPGAVEQILMNLATNARDAMPTGGKLLIVVQRGVLDEDRVQRAGWGQAGEYVTLTVSDTGCGMDAETQRRIFEPFFTTKPVGQGTGLGMPMVYGLVRQHEGFVDVYSEPGEGTTVRVHFPAVAGEGAERATAPAPEVCGGTETILLVEDNEGLRRAAIRVLEKHGYTVLRAADGREALKLLSERDRPPDLIISDVVMPRMSGPELVQALREAGWAPRVLFTSGYPARDIAERLQSGPGIPCLVKPWTGSELLRMVREVLDATADA